MQSASAATGDNSGSSAAAPQQPQQPQRAALRSASRGRQAAARAPPACQVAGCDARLDVGSRYQHRTHLCALHLCALEVPAPGGGLQRFCQGHHKLHPLAQFTGSTHTCTAKLAKMRERIALRASRTVQPQAAPQAGCSGPATAAPPEMALLGPPCAGEDECGRGSGNERGGMSAAECAHAFEPYYRAPAHRGGGTGLGLYICKRFCAALGGSLAVQSAPGKGATFELAVPVRVAPPGAAEAAPAVKDAPLSGRRVERGAAIGAAGAVCKRRACTEPPSFRVARWRPAAVQQASHLRGGRALSCAGGALRQHAARVRRLVCRLQLRSSDGARSVKLQRNSGEGSFPTLYDNPGPPNARALTVLRYLNYGGAPGDGGELVPLMDRAVPFLSDRILHHTQPSRCERLAVTTWIDGDAPREQAGLRLPPSALQVLSAIVFSWQTGADAHALLLAGCGDDGLVLRASTMQRAVSRAVYAEVRAQRLVLLLRGE